ncbi:hypothetical protein [Pseudomonas sp. MOIL14HWK12:I2]|uniref:hypothetical protein n=1 Tax=Pseudomonas sp. MOIL14HWK12:I2 TaxID=1033994 RepID=UPI0012EC76BC|nr:hypothetical protein [Pseudomonas sp. MOIL14HWK12:I2]
MGNVALKEEGAHDQAPSSMSVHSQIKSYRLDSVLEKLNDTTGSRQPPVLTSALARRHPARRPTLSRLLERLRRTAGSSTSGERDAERRRAPNEVITQHPRPDR